MLGAPWLVATQVQSLPLSSRGLPFCRLSGSSPFVSLMRTCVFGFRAWLHPGWCLEILTKLLYPDKVTCKTSVGMHLWGASLPLTTVGGELSLSFQAPKDQWVNPPAWLLPSDPVLDLPFLCLYHRGLTLRVPASPQLPAGGHWLKTGGRGRSSWGIPPPSSLPWAAMVSLAAAALLIDEPSVIPSSSSDSFWLWGHDFFLPSF